MSKKNIQKKSANAGFMQPSVVTLELALKGSQRFNVEIWYHLNVKSSGA